MVRILVLGGTRFLSRAVVRAALDEGHDVLAACRGTEAVPDGATHLPLDRAGGTAGPLAELAGVEAVVDVARTPSWVERAVAALPRAHWVFVSSVSVYAEHSTQDLGSTDLPLLPAIHDDRDPLESPEVYGAMKVACERLVQQGTDSCYLVRPGLIVGPGDPSGRFTYWPVRLDRARQRPGPVLAPGDPDDLNQVIDVRDLAAWIVSAAARRVTGVVDAVGPVHSRSDLLAAVADGVGAADPDWRWVSSERLLELGVEPWMGAGSLPLWLPPEHAGLLAHDPAPARAAGLEVRPVARTAGDTLAWWRETDGALTGLTEAQEADLLARA